MKYSKHISCLCLVFSIYFQTLFNQEYKLPAENTKDNNLVLEDFMDNLPIEGYNGKEIIITRIDNSSNSSSREFDNTNGLRPVYGGGIDNTKIGLHMEKEGNKVIVTCLLPINKKSAFKVKVPNMFSLKIHSSCERSNDVSISDMNNDIEIKNCQSINLKNISGSIIVSTISGNIFIDRCILDKYATISTSTISGNIYAVLSQISTKEPISFNSISGNIDITLPAKIPANINLKSISGTVYTDFDFSDNSKNTNQIIGTTINNQINGGGMDIKLSTVSGNIYLRKGH